MKRFFTCLILIFGCFYFVHAQDYAASLIPDSLKENAHSVLRTYSEDFKLNSVNSGSETVRKVITVLNRNGDDDAMLYLNYDKNSSVTVTKARIYDKNGKLVKKIKDSEISDFPMYDGSSMYSDNRKLYYKPSYAEYPYTVEYEYEYTYKKLFSYSGFYPLNGYEIAVEQASFSFTCPASVTYNKKELCCLGESKKIKEKDRIKEIWTFNNLKAIEYESFTVSFKERVPQVYLMPTQLVYDNYVGGLSDWKDYGKWIYKLYEGRDVLDEKEKPKVDAVLRKAKTSIDSIKFLYEYMQNHTRYVGIQLGIGGFQPFSAQSVYENGYGDCKALSNYMYSLLLYAGIKSHPVLVSAGTFPESNFKDFPNFSTFNHVILCVPNNNDTIWLECTNQTIPFGFLGNFTDDRDVLLLTPDAGKWAHTKQYTARDNELVSKTSIIIDSLGNATASINTSYKGLQYDASIRGFIDSNADEQKKWIYSTTSLPSMSLTNYKVENNKNIIPSATISISALSRNYCSFSGNYMILPLNVLNTQSAVTKLIKKRISDFRLDRPSINYDTIIYTIPSNYAIGSLPQGKTIKSDYGEYTFTVKADGDKIIYCRKYELKSGRFKASEYKQFYDFMFSVSKADNIKVMLTKKL